MDAPTRHLNARRATNMSQMFENNTLYSFQVFGGVHVIHVGRLHIQLVVRAEVLVVLVHGNFWSVPRSRVSSTFATTEAY